MLPSTPDQDKPMGREDRRVQAVDAHMNRIVFISRRSGCPIRSAPGPIVVMMPRSRSGDPAFRLANEPNELVHRRAGQLIPLPRHLDSQAAMPPFTTKSPRGTGCSHTNLCSCRDMPSTHSCPDSFTCRARGGYEIDSRTADHVLV